MLWKNPRVSLETLFDAILQQHPRSEEKSFKNLQHWQNCKNSLRQLRSLICVFRILSSNPSPFTTNFTTNR